MTEPNDNTLERVRKLLAKAEDAGCTAEEAEATGQIFNQSIGQ